MNLRAIALSTALVASSLVAGPALAQPTDEDLQAARVELEAGDAHFEAGRYTDAVESYGRGYARSGKAGFLYNIGQAHRLAGNCAESVASYQRYLAEDPTTSRRAEVEGHIADQMSCARETTTDTDNAPVEIGPVGTTPRRVSPPRPNPVGPASSLTVDTTATTSSDDGSGKRWAGIGVASVGAIALGAGVYFGLDARSKSDELDELVAASDDRDWNEGSDFRTRYEAIESDGRSSDRNMKILTGVGVVAIAGGLGLYLWGRSDDSESLSAMAVPRSGGGSFALSGRF